ncbi:unnamed protein product [Prorocentrum cordatum]|uniref:AP complex mu/sigma subunit domain-containing protein n=1 Tax=Prorocentrum cordatum TaxID=2364126 RepID=A0ABN9UNI0_9DINO|nr:unnamed protein product [Polarella glacialis]
MQPFFELWAWQYDGPYGSVQSTSIVLPHLQPTAPAVCTCSATFAGMGSGEGVEAFSCAPATQKYSRSHMSRGVVSRGTLLGELPQQVTLRTVDLAGANAGADDGLLPSVVREISLLRSLSAYGHEGIVRLIGVEVLGEKARVVAAQRGEQHEGGTVISRVTCHPILELPVELGPAELGAAPAAGRCAGARGVLRAPPPNPSPHARKPASVTAGGAQRGAALIINNLGKPRLARFYYPIPVDQQQRAQKALFSAVSRRSDELSCAFADDDQGLWDDDHKIIYRHYATLYFIFVVDSSESELGILDLIQVFVQVLDTCFENVCELDLIYHFDRVNFISRRIGRARHVWDGRGDQRRPGHPGHKGDQGPGERGFPLRDVSRGAPAAFPPPAGRPPLERRALGRHQAVAKRPGSPVALPSNILVTFCPFHEMFLEHFWLGLS